MRSLSMVSWIGRWLTLVGMVTLIAASLPGCAGSSAVQRMGEGRPDIVTDSDETPERKRARIRVELALAYFQQGKTTIALDEVKQAIQADPLYFDAQNLRGLIYMSLGDAALAEDSFNRALALRSNSPDVLHNLGWLECQQARYARAIDHFTQALADPQYRERAKTWMTLGLCQQRAGMSAAAEQSLFKSYEMDAANPVTAYNLAELLYRRGQNERAAFYIRRLNSSELANAESLWLGVRIEHRLGNRDTMAQWGAQLDKRFEQSPQAAAYRRGAFDD